MLIKLIAVIISLSTLVHYACASHKKGLAVAGANYMCHDLDPFTGIHWWYDWASHSSHDSHHCSNHIRQPHIPMLWTWGSHSHLSVSSSDHTILGFNEPNFHEQANLRPDVAANYWRQMQNQGGNSRVLVSPAAAPGGYMQPVQWFTEFFQHCHDCKVDFLATHAYWCDPHITMHYLQDLYNRFHKKIWLTEFCCPHTTSATDQLNYMKAILPMLEQADYVDRYSWFVHRIKAESGFVTRSASLLEPYNSNLTPLGHYYNNFAG